jgi:ribose 5-phosphate isomerase B
MNIPTIAIASDHAGLDLKDRVVAWLQHQHALVRDFGPFSDTSVDYPDFAHEVARAVENNEYQLGILICGTGIGMSMAANRHAGIRAALCWRSDIAQLAKSHNDANIICLPGRFMDADTAYDILSTFFHSSFEGGRHQRRLGKLGC